MTFRLQERKLFLASPLVCWNVILTSHFLARYYNAKSLIYKHNPISLISVIMWTASASAIVSFTISRPVVGDFQLGPGLETLPPPYVCSRRAYSRWVVSGLDCSICLARFENCRRYLFFFDNTIVYDIRLTALNTI